MHNLKNYSFILLLLSILSTNSVEAQESFDPIGEYQLTTFISELGMSVSANLEIVSDEDQYAARLRSDLDPEGSVTRDVTVEGREIRLGVGTPDGDISIVLAIANDDSLEGSWSTLGAGGSFTGRKIR
ncbi:MAG TPA: hypothetical protein EYQ69_02350 [Gemmatimonadetes bacterium]|jgi:hypothetical protein|nr:hypothetical protein [Gemmatimonadota bacterium]